MSIKWTTQSENNDKERKNPQWNPFYVFVISFGWFEWSVWQRIAYGVWFWIRFAWIPMKS